MLEGSSKVKFARSQQELKQALESISIDEVINKSLGFETLHVDSNDSGSQTTSGWKRLEIAEEGRLARDEKEGERPRIDYRWRQPLRQTEPLRKSY
jgi:hypothetical protein